MSILYKIYSLIGRHFVLIISDWCSWFVDFCLALLLPIIDGSNTTSVGGWTRVGGGWWYGKISLREILELFKKYSTGRLRKFVSPCLLVSLETHRLSHFDHAFPTMVVGDTLTSFQCTLSNIKMKGSKNLTCFEATTQWASIGPQAYLDTDTMTHKE